MEIEANKSHNKQRPNKTNTLLADRACIKVLPQLGMIEGAYPTTGVECVLVFIVLPFHAIRGFTLYLGRPHLLPVGAQHCAP